MTASGDEEEWYRYPHNYYPDCFIRVAKKTKMGGFTEEAANQINKQVNLKYTPGTERSQTFEVTIGDNGTSRQITIYLDLYGHVTLPPTIEKRIQRTEEIIK
jgi:hypothetical protein